MTQAVLTIGQALCEAIAHHQAQRLPEAERLYHAILEVKPHHPEVLSNLGDLLRQHGKLDDAVARCREALAIRPAFPEALINLGNALKEQGRLEEAVSSYAQALHLTPDNPEILLRLGSALREKGSLQEAEAAYERALAIKPQFAEALVNLGNVLLEQSRFAEAIDRYQQALAIKPDYPIALSNLGNALRESGKFGEAITCYERALAIDPNYVSALTNLGHALQQDGRLRDAASRYEQALAIKPDHAVARSALLFVRAAQADFDADRYLAAAAEWQAHCVGPHVPTRRGDFRRRPLVGRRLRLGYVSGDYRRHAVSYFIEELFARHDRTRIELVAYSASGKRDEITDRLQERSDKWVTLAGLSDLAARDCIVADEIDVLVDLSGHTAHNRLGVFALRAAPVQAHYLSFVSTGLSQMDYFVGDENVTPCETDAHFRETVWRLPRPWVTYDAKEEAPLPAWRPAQDGNLWVGSFCNIMKLSAETVDLWTRVLQALPEARLLLKTAAFGDPDVCRRLIDGFAARSIGAGRILLLDSSLTLDWRQHMACHDRLDVALDPVGGLGGGTTTLDALWMGVPVVALEGGWMATRMTSSCLRAIERSEWIARDEQDYVDKVVALARDVAGRKAMRSEQRARMAASPLCDAAGLARALEDAFIAMFARWEASSGR